MEWGFNRLIIPVILLQVMSESSPLFPDSASSTESLSVGFQRYLKYSFQETIISSVEVS